MGCPSRRAVLRAGALAGLSGVLGVGCRGTGKQSAATAATVSHPSAAAPSEPELAMVPPSAARVLARLEALLTTVVRAEFEQSLATGGDEKLAFLQRAILLAWCKERGLGDEFEPEEAAFIAAEPGTPTVRDRINASWRSEGVIVLGWALGLVDALPPHDALADITPVADALGLPMGERVEGLTPPKLRGPLALDWQSRRLLGVHWRLVDYSIRPEPMDFEAFATKNWFGGFDPTGVAMVDGDLALRGASIHEAPPEDRRMATSIAMERHRAINWLEGFDPVYSQVDIST